MSTVRRSKSGGKDGHVSPGFAPDPKTLSDVFAVLPKDILEVSYFFVLFFSGKVRPYFALFAAARVWLTVLAGFYFLTIAPWYLVPLAWIFLGTAATGLFVVGHDCAHQSFSRSRVLNEIVGTICMGPLFFPYSCWEMSHNNHHRNANNLDKDHLWRPITKAELSKMSTFQKYLSYYMFGPLFFESSIIHHFYHFLFPILSPRQRMSNLRSIFFALLFGSMTVYAISFVGSLFKLFVVPFLVFQFWLSTFTYFHHRSPHGAGWKEDTDWNPVYGSLFATVHVAYPAWIEWLTLDINWHLPHHVSALIPWYNLRRATHALFKAYGDRLLEEEWSWELWKETTTTCHVYSKEHGYVSMLDAFQ